MRKFSYTFPLVVLLALFFNNPGWAQGPYPPTSVPWWQITEDKIPYVFTLILVAIAFILGGVARPLVTNVGNVVLRWIQGWGKHGDFRQRYLDECVGRCRHLALLPANIVAARWEYRRRAVDLEELYTSLSMGEERAELNLEEGELVRRIHARESRIRSPNRWQSIWWRIRPPVVPSAGDLGIIIQNFPRLVIRGDPGSGKTTLLRYLAITCARNLRNERRDGDSPRMVRERLGWKTCRFPILVNLSLYADVGSWPKDKRLLDAIIDTLPGELQSRYPKGFFEKWLNKGGCLVMFDGFDELGNRSARNRMARLIDDLVTTYNHPDNRFLVSTRIVGYEGQLDSYGFTVRTVEDLDPGAVSDLVRRRYCAIAIGEGLGCSEGEQKDLLRRYENRANDLLIELEENEGLRVLTSNPLLLSLIVLVSLVQVKLPEQRHILYRDCIEVLAERWQQQRKADAGAYRLEQPRPDDLELDQKTALLRDIALDLQIRREEGESQILMTRERAQRLIAARLPDFIAAYLSENPIQQEQECERRAAEFLNNIRAESGILVERGLDLAGEPVVGFSHLTFQEYLAADALRRQPNMSPVLLENLFNPAWREVLLLYVSMEQGDEVIKACLKDERQPLLTRYLLAGRCLAAEGPVNTHLRRQALSGLQTYLLPSGVEIFRRVQDLIERLGGLKQYDWLLENYAELLNNEERDALAVPAEDAEIGFLYTQFQQELVRWLTGVDEINTRYQAGIILGGIGDPRFNPDVWNLPDDSMLGFFDIPAGPFLMGSRPEIDDDFRNDEVPQDQVLLPDFYVARYPVTEEQFLTFVDDSGVEPVNTDSLRSLSNHPVVRVTWHKALKYCEWLTGKLCAYARGREDGGSGEQGSLGTGERAFWEGLASGNMVVTLPSEAQWEKAARGTDGRIYPWEGEFDPNKANTSDTGIGRRSAVGCFPGGASPYGMLDMSGNVFEWTRSLWGKDWKKPDYDYPYDPADGREDLSAEDNVLRVVRGGAFFSSRKYARCACRRWGVPSYPFRYVGFRVVVCAPPNSEC